jgi:hypothetical protein
MKNLLIIYPHWPPSNLTGLHRARLIANYLEDFGWHPVMLTVAPVHYEEKPDYDLVNTVSPRVEVVTTDAFPVLSLGGYRLLGDIGLRAWWQLYREARKIISRINIDFIWIPVPSWYPALLGPLLLRKTGVPYGVDYIDPWVSHLAPFDKRFSRAWLVLQLARLLEPVAVRNASLISGVSKPYYQGVLDRNFRHKPVVDAAMPYGYDPNDHKVVLKGLQTPWPEDGSVQPLVYAGIFLPQSHLFLDRLFSVVREMLDAGIWQPSRQFWFLGAGYYQGRQVMDYARDHGIAHLVHEIHQRFAFLEILNFLGRASAILVVGSTERHYTASKIFQSLLSGRPVVSIFHAESSAAAILRECDAAEYSVLYKEDFSNADLDAAIRKALTAYLDGNENWKFDASGLDRYSAKESARILVQAMENVVTPSAGHSVKEQ